MTPEEIESLAAERADHVMALCDRLVDEARTLPAQAETLRLALVLGRRQVASAPLAPLLQLPLAVHEAVAGDWRPAVPVAAACHLLYLGADILDNIADHELPVPWELWGPDQAALVACTLLYPLAQEPIARAPVGPHVRLGILRQLAAATQSMAAGQQEELRRSVRDDVDPDAAWRTAATKSGAEGEVACRAAALLAGASLEVVEAVAAFGRAYATAVQVTSDCQDIWAKDVSPDLANARPTPPVAYGLWTTPANDRPTLRQRILAAGWDPVAQAGIRTELARRGALAYCALRVHVLQGEAVTALRRAGAADQPLLRLLIDRVWPWA